MVLHIWSYAADHSVLLIPSSFVSRAAFLSGLRSVNLEYKLKATGNKVDKLNLDQRKELFVNAQNWKLNLFLEVIITKIFKLYFGNGQCAEASPHSPFAEVHKTFIQKNNNCETPTVKFIHLIKMKNSPQI